MRVIFFTRYFYPHIGGVEKHVEKISELLIKDGYEVTIITTRYNNTLPLTENYKNINVLRFRQPQIKFIGLFYTWIYLIRKIFLIINADIIHIHDVFIWYLPIRIILPFKKVYLTIHGRWGIYPIPLIDVMQKKVAVIFSEKVLSIGEYIPKYYSIKSNYVSYGASDKIIKSTGNERIGNNNIITNNKRGNEKKNTILYVGRLDKDTPLSKYFSAFEILKKDYKILFCGDGELRKKCEEYGVVLGFNDPSRYYKKAKYVFVSGYLTIIEALLNMCIVICAYQNKLQKSYYFMTPFRKFIYIENDPLEIVKIIKKCDLNKNQYNKKVMLGYNWAKAQTWQKLALTYKKMWASPL